MRCGRVHFGGLLACLFYTLCISCAIAEPNNGRFEFYDYNETTLLNNPIGWNTENYVTVLQVLIPTPSQGSTSNWRINTETGLHPFEGESFLVLNSGNWNIQYGKAWRSITIGEGDKLTGAYFFGACDYSPYNDWAEIKLVSNNPDINDINIVHADIALLGDYGSFGGWKRFEYTFGANEVGDYNLVLFVSDYGDTQLESYLAVDGIVLCRYHEDNPPPEKADFNCDCTVNFEDFAILANDWQYDCNNPIIYNDSSARPRYYDPNCSCLIGTDINGNGPVDMNDLQIMSENWLEGIKE